MKKSLLAAVAVSAIPALLSAQNSGQIRPGSERVNPSIQRVGQKIAGSWICTMDDATPGNAVAQAARNAAAAGGGRLNHVYTGALKGFALHAPEQAINRVMAAQGVKSCEQDQVMAIASNGRGKPAPEITIQADSTPWGVALVGGGTTGTFKRAWVIDSGIASHPDLNIDTARSRSFVSGLGYGDGNGHGTHVAGTIAAKANGSGVIGVAPGASVVSLRVFDGSGSGSNSAVIAAVDHVYNNAAAGDVVNMSLGGGTSTTLDNAVLRASNRGIYFALAAGNESMNANNSSPGRVNGTYIWTVSAFDSSKRFASFSNYGNPPIDVSEPGVNIQSTYLNGGYASLSGTSMATPHLAGLILQRSVRNGGRVTGDPDGNADIIGIK